MTLIKHLLAIAALLSALALPQVAHADLNPNLSITPDPLNFDSVRPGGSSGPETLRVLNTASSGGASISVSDIGLTDETNFRIDIDGCSGRTLNPGTYCEVQTSFAPAGDRGGYFSGFVVFSSESPIGASVLHGQVIAPQVSLTPASVHFGNQAIGKPSAPNDVTMKNTGDATLTITSISTAAPFSVTDDCGNTLAAGESCTVSATFSPVSEGAVSGSIPIVSDAPTTPDSIALTGTGVAADQPVASFSTNALNFGGQLINTTSAAQTVAMSNTGTVNLAINSIMPPEGFSTSDDCGNELAPGAACTISATFTPVAAQAYAGMLAVATNAGDSPHNIALEGFGANDSGPKAVFSQTSIDFGEQALRTPSNPSTTTITSEGSEALILESVTKTADSTGSFSGTDNCSGKTLNPGQSCSIDVIFNPQEKGTLGATASIADNSPGSPQTLIATGVGVHISGGNCALVAWTSSAHLLHQAMLLMLPAGIVFFRRRRS